MALSLSQVANRTTHGFIGHANESIGHFVFSQLLHWFVWLANTLKDTIGVNNFMLLEDYGEYLLHLLGVVLLEVRVDSLRQLNKCSTRGLNIKGLVFIGAKDLGEEFRDDTTQEHIGVSDGQVAVLAVADWSWMR